MIDYFDCSCKPDATIFCPNCVQYLRSKRSKGVKMSVEKIYLPQKAQYVIKTEKFGSYYAITKFNDHFVGVSFSPVDYLRDEHGNITHRFYEMPHKLWFYGNYMVECLATPLEIMVYSHDDVPDDEIVFEDLEEELEF